MKSVRVRVPHPSRLFDVLRERSRYVQIFVPPKPSKPDKPDSSQPYTLVFPPYMRDGVRPYLDDLLHDAPRERDLRHMLAALHVAFFLQDDVGVGVYKRLIDDAIRTAWARDGPPAFGVYAVAHSPSS